MYTQVHEQLAPLLSKHPGFGTFRTLECQAAMAAAPGEAATIQRCTEGATAAKDAAAPSVMLASAHLGAKNPVAATEALTAGITRIKAGATDGDGLWVVVAQLARQLGCVTTAEEAVARAGTAAAVEPVRAWVTRTRRWTGLTAPSATCEREHVESFRAILKLMERSTAQAAGRIAAFAPGPARDSLQCELGLRKNQLPSARAACERAVAAFDESTHARYLLGVIAEGEGKHSEVVKHLTRLLELDAENDDAWSRLAAAHRKLGDAMQVQILQTRFQARFGRPLR
jgi:predicted Zn-dependent protease